MEKNQMIKIPIKFANIGLLFAVVWITIEHILGFNTTRHDIGQHTRNATMYLSWLLAVFTIISTRRELGSLSFFEGFKASLIYAIFYSFVFSIIIAVYQHQFNPEFYSSIKQFTLRELQKRNASSDEIQSAMKEIEMSYSGNFLSYILLFIFSTILNTISGLIATLVLRKKKGI
jgi:hypothetical protein